MGGSLAYVAQQAWIVNDSLQSNVLFGQELSEQRWEACVHACSLQQDLEVSFNLESLPLAFALLKLF
jgi:ATP-binding cassette subfamily C (CFTR/MRP) protein 1